MFQGSPHLINHHSSTRPLKVTTSVNFPHDSMADAPENTAWLSCLSLFTREEKASQDNESVQQLLSGVPSNADTCTWQQRG